MYANNFSSIDPWVEEEVEVCLLALITLCLTTGEISMTLPVSLVVRSHFRGKSTTTTTTTSLCKSTWIPPPLNLLFIICHSIIEVLSLLVLGLIPLVHLVEIPVEVAEVRLAVGVVVVDRVDRNSRVNQIMMNFLLL